MEKKQNRSRVNCYNCTSYYVTWIPAQPHGCRKLGFRSQQLPSLVVYKDSGITCMYYTPKR